MLDLGGNKKGGLVGRLGSWLTYVAPVILVILCSFLMGWLIWAVINGIRIDDLGESNDNQEKMLKNIYNQQAAQGAAAAAVDPDCYSPSTCQWGFAAGGVCMNGVYGNKPDGTECSSNCYWNTTSCDGGVCKSENCKGECETQDCVDIDFGNPLSWESEVTCFSGIIAGTKGWCSYSYKPEFVAFTFENAQSGADCSHITQALCEAAVPDMYKDCMEVSHVCSPGTSLLSGYPGDLWTSCKASFKCSSFAQQPLLV